MDSSCSRHMAGNDKWFSSLTPMRSKEYIVFGDNGRGKVRGIGTVRVSDRFTLREVALPPCALGAFEFGSILYFVCLPCDEFWFSRFVLSA